MGWYLTLINGRNFRLDFDGKVGRYGFYQTVLVQAADLAEAETNAIAIVKGDEELQELVKNEQSDPPMLCMDSYQELDASEIPPAPEGRTYYPEKSWWQFWRR